MSQQAEHNLLVGILAVQLDFITGDQLVRALHSWVQQKDRPLNSILVEEGALDSDTEPVLRAVVKRHLELHQNKVEESIAAVSTLGSLEDQLAALDDPEIAARLGIEHSELQERVDRLLDRSMEVVEYAGVSQMAPGLLKSVLGRKNIHPAPPLG